MIFLSTLNLINAKYFPIGSCSLLSPLLKCCVLVTLLSSEWEDVLLKSSLARLYWISGIFDISIWKTKMFMESSYQIGRKFFYNRKLSNTLDSRPLASFIFLYILCLTVHRVRSYFLSIWSENLSTGRVNKEEKLQQKPHCFTKTQTLAAATTGSAIIMYTGRGREERKREGGREEGISYKLYFDNRQVGYQGQISYLFQ